MQHRPTDHSDRFGISDEAANILEQLGTGSRAPGRVRPTSNGRGHRLSKDVVSDRGRSVAVTDSIEEEGGMPDWLDLFLNGELEVEEVADRLADEIRRDPRLIRTAWWQQFLNRFVAVVPDRLVDMAERLSDCRHRLLQENPER